MFPNEFIISDLALNSRSRRHLSEADFYEIHGRKPVVIPGLSRAASKLTVLLANMLPAVAKNRRAAALPAE